MSKKCYDEKTEEDVWLLKVAKDSTALQYVPQNIITKEMCLLAARNNYIALKYIPSKFKTRDMCLFTLLADEDPSALDYIPLKLMTDSMWLYAIFNHVDFMEEGQVPKKFKTSEKWLVVICAEPWFIIDFKKGIHYIDGSPLTEEMCIVAVTKQGDYIKDIPEKFKTKAVCVAAVYIGKSTIKYIPSDLKYLFDNKSILKSSSLPDYEMMHYEIKSSSNDLKKEEKEELEEDFWLLVVGKDGLKLKNVPANVISLPMCFLAVRQNYESLKYVPAKFKTYELCLVAILTNPKAIEYVPEKIMTDGMCLLSVFLDPSTIYIIPDKFRTHDVWLATICTDSTYIFEFFKGVNQYDKVRLTEEMCIAAVRKNGYMLNLIASKFKTKAVCIAAVIHEKNALRLVPSKFKYLFK